LVKIIDVVRNRQRANNFFMTMIRLSGSQLHAARVLVGLSREDLAERAGLCRHSIRKWETSSHAIPSAMYPHLCRVVDILEGEGARFTGDGVSTLSGELPLSNGSGTSRHQLRTIARVYISVWIWLLGSVTPAYATRA
jgi:transcriptional regulator with XRE-family HTH domain